jgi:regulator of sigma E protease
MRPSDVVIEAGGKPLLAPEALGDLVERIGPGQPIDLKIKRDSRVVEIRVAPETPLYPPEVPSDERRAMIGIEWERTGKWTVDHPDPWRQISDSVKSMVNTFEALFTPKSDVKAQHLSGFVGIMRIYYVLFEDANGWRQAIWFSVILNVNLALLNLLPIPVLDGGHILLALLEGLRRRPIRARTLAALQTACAVLIIGYMAYVTFFDVQDLPWKRPQQIEIRFPDPSPPAAPPGVTP